MSGPESAVLAGIDPLDDAQADPENQYVTFSVAGESFAVPMGPVQEIIRVPELARLPLAPPALDGLANLRGRVLPIVSLRRLFNAEEVERDDATRAVVIQLGQPLGFVVDRVTSVVNIEPTQFEPASGIRSVADVGFLTGIIKRPQADGSTQMLLALDFQQLVESHFAAIGAAAAAGSVDGAGAASAAGERAGSDADGEAGDELRLVSFSVAAQEYAIDIADVQEIVQLPEHVIPVPKAPRHVLGVITLRDRVLPLVSLRALFALPAVALDERHRIVVVGLPDGNRVGLVTDDVKEVLGVPRELADAMPAMLAQDPQMREFASICRLDQGRRLVSIIATARLLGMPEIAAAVQAAQAVAAADSKESGMREQDADEGDEESLDDNQVVVFRLGSEEFGVPITSVQEIVRIPEQLTRVPRTPAFVEGVINLRGAVLPIIDQRCRLGMPSIERHDGQRIMVYTFDGVRTGFVVDAVAEVLRIGADCIDAAPHLSDEQARLISRIAKLDGGRRMVLLIEPRHLLGAPELAEVSALLDTDGPAGHDPALDASAA